MRVRGYSLLVGVLAASAFCPPADVGAQELAGEVRGIKIVYFRGPNEWRNPRGCVELPDVIEALDCFPETLLDWLAGFDLQILVYAPDVFCRCPYGASGCYEEPSRVIIQGGTDSTKAITVHEVAHAIDELLPFGHELCDRNLRLIYLDRLQDEFDGVFGVPGELGWVDYDNYEEQESVPDGFVSRYAPIDQGEDFAESCKYYVMWPDDFLLDAEEQAREGNLRLLKKYLTLYRDLFLERSFTDMVPNTKGFFTLTAVENEPRDGRLAPGERFSLRLEMTLFEELGGANQVRCVAARDGDDGVTVLRSTAAANGLHRWQTYTFDDLGDYQVNAGLTRDRNFDFRVQCRLADGRFWTLGTAPIPLNVEGYLWAFRSPDNWRDCGVEGASLVRLSSTLLEMEAVPLPGAICDVGFPDYEAYDSRRGLFWFFPFEAYGEMARFDRSSPDALQHALLDPQNLLLGAEEVDDIFYNPVDGAFWLLIDCEKYLRVSLSADGRVERRVIDLTDAGSVELEAWPRLSVDPRSGKVWISRNDAVCRYGRSGDREAVFEGIGEIEQLAASPDGGCLAHLDGGNSFVRIGPDGVPDPAVSYNVGLDDSHAMIGHPYDGAIWFHSWEQQRLVRAADGADAARSWDGARGWPVPGFEEGSIFLVRQEWVEEEGENAENVDRYLPDGTVQRGGLSLLDCSIFGFEPAGGGIPRLALWDGAVYLPPGGSFGFPGNTSAAFGAPGSTRELAMENTGGRELAVTRIAVEGAGAAHFGIVAPYPARVAPGARAPFTVRFAPKSAGIKTAAVVVTTDDPTMPRYSVTVSGTAVAPEIDVTRDGRAIVSGGASDLGTVWVGAYSPWAVFTVRNTGSSPLTIGGYAMAQGAEEFIFAAPSPGRLEPGAATVFIVVLAPESVGAKSALVTLRSDDPDESVFTVRITGTAVMPPDIGVKRGAVAVPAGGGCDFGNTRVDHQGYVEFSVENRGGATLHLDSWAITGEHAAQFGVALTPHQNISPGSASLMSVIFVPTSEGAKRATLTLRSNDPDRPAYAISLTGTGYIAQDIGVLKGGEEIPSPAGSFGFGDVRVGRVSAPAALVIRNAGRMPLNVAAPALSGFGAGQFRLQPCAAQNIAPGGEAGFTIDFRPALAGDWTATVSIANNDPDRSESPYTFTVTGRGVAPDINIRGGTGGLPSGKGTYSYGEVPLGSARSAVFIIENTGTYKLVLTPNAPVAPRDAATFQVTSYNAGTVTAGGSTFMIIRFSPSVAGLRSATVTVVSDDPDENPYTFTVAGTGTPQT